MTDPLIELENVWVCLGGQTILEDITLSIYPGEFHAIIGPNGGGKTTLLKVILGLVSPTQGRVRICGGPPEEHRNILGYVPQFRTFDFQYPITVIEMVLSGRLGHVPSRLKRYGKQDLAIARGALETMGILELADREIHDLSGGQQQRAIISRALVGNPKVLLLDEPTVYVDAPTETQFYEVLDGFRDQMAIVLITHDVGVLSQHVTRISCLNRRIFTHETNEITEEMIGSTYPCPVDLIAHGIPHRVLREHDTEE